MDVAHKTVTPNIFRTKIHVNVYPLGNPLRFILTAEQRHDITQAAASIIDYEFERLIVEKGAYFERVVYNASEHGMSPVGIGS